MKILSTNILFCLLLALFSCNQNSRTKKPSEIKVKQVITTENEHKSETSSQKNENLTNELLSFVPKNYSILDTVSGDLNLDQINDYILVLKKNGEDTLSDIIDNPERRPLIILLRNKDNKLQIARKNNNTVLCFDCGGIMGDPFMGVTIKNGYFSVEHYGGSAWRWSRIITYKYSKQDKEWFLHKDGSQSYHTSEPEKIESNIKTAKDFGRIKFEDFDIYQED